MNKQAYNNMSHCFASHYISKHKEKMIEAGQNLGPGLENAQKCSGLNPLM